MWSYLLRGRLQKRPHLLKKNPYLPYLTSPSKHAKHFEKMADLTYAELTKGRESTRLPHTHKFTSLKNVVIFALHKIDK